jgi:hypothetical protein
MVDKVALGQIYLWLRPFTPVSVIQSVLYTYLSKYQEGYLIVATKNIVKIIFFNDFCSKRTLEGDI